MFESYYIDEETSEHVGTISLAMENSFFKASILSRITDRYQEHEEDGVWVFPIYMEDGHWCVPAIISFIPYETETTVHENGEFGYRYFMYNVHDFDDRGLGKRILGRQGMDDTYFWNWMVIETLAMLNCVNVDTALTTPSDKLNKQRRIKNKTPFFRYHVLKVAGHTYNPTRMSNGSGLSKSTHFRRGHLRRIGDRKVTWVRHTIVARESKTKVDKSYKL